MGIQGAALGLLVGKEMSFNRLKSLDTDFGRNLAQYDLTFLTNEGFSDIERQLKQSK
jgi:hypothetical protein